MNYGGPVLFGGGGVKEGGVVGGGLGGRGSTKRLIFEVTIAFR